MLLAISQHLSPVRKVAVEFKFDRKFHCAPGKVHDIDIFMHAVADKSRDTKLYRFCANQPAGPEVGPRVGVESRRGGDVVAHPCILMNIRECQRAGQLALDEVPVTGKHPGLVYEEAVVWRGADGAMQVCREHGTVFADVKT